MLCGLTCRYVGIIRCECGRQLLMALFADIGQLYGDARLRELLFESDIFAASSVQQILSESFTSI